LGTTLRERLWSRIQRASGGVSRLAIVGDGELERMPWEALPMGDTPTRYLIETGIQITRLPTELDLLATSEPWSSPTEMVVAGGPAFDAKLPTGDATAALTRGGAAANACVRVNARRLSALPGATAEARALEKLGRDLGWRVRSATGERLTRAWFEAQAPRAQVLHLATHTFSIADSCLPAKDWRDQWLLEPLLRNGLAFAGANDLARAGEAAASPLLTGADIALLDLRGVREVLLSACESDRGQPGLIEGSFGLPRAFRAAGATRVVCSQWPVSDELSAIWMLAYARARWQQHQPAARACRTASRALLASRDRGPISVRDWAAFVVWGPPE
jgi:CHAT domain-containing protein